MQRTKCLPENIRNQDGRLDLSAQQDSYKGMQKNVLHFYEEAKGSAFLYECIASGCEKPERKSQEIRAYRGSGSYIVSALVGRANRTIILRDMTKTTLYTAVKLFIYADNSPRTFPLLRCVWRRACKFMGVDNLV